MFEESRRWRRQREGRGTTMAVEFEVVLVVVVMGWSVRAIM
jgi:hypothetical protein